MGTSIKKGNASNVMDFGFLASSFENRLVEFEATPIPTVTMRAGTPQERVVEIVNIRVYDDTEDFTEDMEEKYAINADTASKLLSKCPAFFKEVKVKNKDGEEEIHVAFKSAKMRASKQKNKLPLLTPKS